MMRSNGVLCLIVIIGCVFVCADNASAEICIDDFSFGSNLSQFGAGNVTQTSSDGSILGGSRDESLTVADLAGDEFFGVVGFGSAMSLGQGTDDEISGFFTYDDFTGIDLTEGGTNDFLKLSFLSTDTATSLADIFTITVISGGFTESVNFDLPSNGSLPTDVWIALTDFATIDFTSVDSVQMSYDFTGNPGRDFTLSKFSAAAIPEPSGLALLMLAGLAVGFRRSRRYLV